jgi:hypothetical protein
VIFVGFIHGAVIVGHAHYPWDYENYHYPLLYYEFSSLRAGTFPLWDGRTYAGMPLVTNPQAALFYPLHLLFFAQRIIAGRDLSSYVAQFLNIFHFTLAGISLFALLRSLKVSRRYSLFGALLWLANGFHLAQAEHLGVIETLAWAPFAFLLVIRLAARPAWVTAALLAVVLSMTLLIGFLPQAAAVFLLCGLLFLAELRRRRQPRWLAGSLRLAAAMLGSLALAAVAMLPVLSNLAYTIPLQNHVGLPPQSVITAILPRYFNTSQLGAYWGPSDLTVTYFYSGIMVLLLLPAAIFWVGGSARPFRFLLGFSVLAGLSPAAELLMGPLQRLPLVGVLIRPESFLPFIPMCAIVLGVSALERLERPGWLRGGAALWLVALVGVGFATPALAHHDVTAQVWLAVGIILGILGLTLLPKPWWKPAVGLACLAELVWFNSGAVFYAYPGASNSLGPNLISGQPSVIPALRTEASGYRVSIDQEVMGGPWNGGWRVWGIDTVNGFEPQLQRRYLDGVLAGGATWHTDRLFDITSYDGPLPQLLNVGFVVTTRPEGLADSHLALVQDGPVKIYRYVDAVGRYLTFSPSAFRCWGVDCTVAVPLSAGQLVKVRAESPNGRTLATVGAAAGSILLWSESWSPGWRATVDGRQVSVVRVNGLVMGVLLPAGSREVKLEYLPESFIAGAAVSGFAWACLLAVLAFSVILRRSGTADHR